MRRRKREHLIDKTARYPVPPGINRVERVVKEESKVTKGVLVNFHLEPFYVFGEFIGLGRADQELQRLKDHIEDLCKEGEWAEIVLCYDIFNDLCKAKAAEALEGEDTNWNLDVRTYYNDLSHQLSRELRESLTNYDRGRGGDYYPYPYIFKPPESPDDIGVATNVQLNQPVSETEIDVELFCRYCGSKLGMDESYCSVCGKKS